MRDLFIPTATRHQRTGIIVTAGTTGIIAATASEQR